MSMAPGSTSLALTKAALIKDHALLAASRAWEAAGAQEIRTQRWRECLQLGLKALARTPEDALRDRKSAVWKAILAAWMKQTTQASNRWLAEQLHMGRPEAVSVYVRRLRTSGAGFSWSSCRTAASTCWR